MTPRPVPRATFPTHWLRVTVGVQTPARLGAPRVELPGPVWRCSRAVLAF